MPKEASQPAVSWPKQGSLLDERGAYGLFCKAFPTLFPKAHGDITSEENRGAMTLEEWGQYLMRHTCGRFAQHDRFRYYLFNRIQRERACSTGSAFHKRYGDDIGSIEELKCLLGEGKTIHVQSLGMVVSEPPWHCGVEEGAAG